MTGGSVWRPDRPYDELPNLPPEAELETRAVLKACVTARAALAELKQAAQLIPNPAMLINTLPLLEAKASSEIENIVTTADRLFRISRARRRMQMPRRRRRCDTAARSEGVTSSCAAARSPPEPRRRSAALSRTPTCRCRNVPGTMLGTRRTRDIYTPPEGETRIRDLLANWESFLHAETDLDPLIRMAAAHYQFEAIHPSSMATAERVGSSTASTRGQGLLTHPILYLSRYIIAQRSDYYRLLLAVTRSAAWEPWLLYILGRRRDRPGRRGRSARYGGSCGDHRLHPQTLPQIYSRELVDAIFDQPYCRIGNLVERGVVGRQAASRHLKALAAIGVMSEVSIGRDKLFLNTRLLGLLTRESNDFAPLESVGRSGR